MSKKPLAEINASEYINIIRERPPPFKFGLWVYNSKEGTVFGRTGSSWGKRTIYLPISFFCWLMCDRGDR